MDNKIKFSRKEKGISIMNQAKENIGIQTGRYFNDYYGTWYEIKRKNGTTVFMIGEHK